MIAVVRSDCNNLSLRQITQRFDAITYHDRMLTSITLAGIYNANGGCNGRAVQWTDFHPSHAIDDTVAMAQEAEAQIDLETIHRKMTQ